MIEHIFLIAYLGEKRKFLDLSYEGPSLIALWNSSKNGFKNYYWENSRV